MNVLIIDNEPLVREGLKTLINTCISSVGAVYEAEGVQTGIKAINTYSPDVVLLDVELDDGTGMDLLNQLETIDFSLVFVTAYNRYAIDAFKFSATDFLLKPVDPEALQNTFKKIEMQQHHKFMEAQLDILKHSLNKFKVEDKKIALKDINSIYFVSVKDIIRCKSHGQYTEFYCEDQNIVVSKSLKEYQELLEPYGFIRPHHSHLINKNKILRFDKANGGIIIMQNHDEIPVSHRKKAHVLNALEKL